MGADFAAGACGGRDRHNRQYCVFEGKRAFVVFNDAVMGQQNADGLGGVHCTAAADRQYAVDAFECEAIDYLLKPVQPARLDATVARLQAAQAAPADAAHLARLLDTLAALPKPAASIEPLTWLTASTGRETALILVDDVIYFRADHKYTTVVTADGEALLRSSLRELLPRLDGNHFKQIHRSTIINLKAIAGISRDESGRGIVRLKQRPETLLVSLPFMTLFKQM